MQSIKLEHGKSFHKFHSTPSLHYALMKKYDIAEDTGGPEITYGRSKDKRPDLKQFMVELMCVHLHIQYTFLSW